MDITKFVAAGREEALLAGDYNSYRVHLTRRLHVVRKRLGLTTPKGRKYAAKSPVTVDNVAKSIEYVHVLLLSSERAWALAMHMKAVHSADTSAAGIVGSTRTHIITKLHTASLYASQLATLLEDRTTTKATEVDLLEARAYQASLAGSMYLEKQSWENSLQQFAIARIIYDTLASSGKSEVYRELLSGTVDPSIRYAAYQLKLPRTQAIPSLAAEKFPSSAAHVRREIESVNPHAFSTEAAGFSQGAEGAGQELPTSITWRQRKVKLEDAAIAQALAAEAAVEPKLRAVFKESRKSAKDKAAAYDGVISASQDAVEATKTAIDEMAKEGVAAGDSRMQALQITRTAVNYNMIGWRVGRNRVLAGDSDGLTGKGQQQQKRGAKEESTGRLLARLREVLTLYDGIIQSIETAQELPGVAADSDLIDELEGQLSYFQALRCLTIARSHAILGKPQNSLALLNKALQLTTKAESSASSDPSGAPQAPPKMTVHVDQVKALQQLLQGLVWQHQALVELEKASSKESKGEAGHGLPLVERLNEYPSGGVDLSNLVVYPPQIQPIPVKPLFFDVAWNYLEYPGQKQEEVAAPVTADAMDVDGEESSAATEAKAESKRKGWFGFGR